MRARLPLLALVLGGCSAVISRADDLDTGDVSMDTGDTDPVDVVPDDTGDDTGDETGDDTTGDNEDDAVYAAFFDPATIQTLDLVLSDVSLRRLSFEPREYVVGDVVVNGVSFFDVGIRLKGSSTFEDLDCSDGECKASFKIKLSEFEADQAYGGLERITLNNMASDYSQSKEVIVYDLLHRNSQLASRCNYARVTLNGEPWGLYANVESTDEHWLARRFDDASGEFWGTASAYGDFYQPYLDTGWVTKSGTGNKSQLVAVTAALDAYAGDFFAELGALVDTDQWLVYWAWCVVTGNFDGYPFNLNDVLIYGDPANGGRYVFAPWGTDESWDEGSGRWNTVSGRLGEACLADETCVDALLLRIDRAIEQYEATDVVGMAQAAWDLSEADVLTDPKRPFSPDNVWAYRDHYEGVMPAYGDYVRARVGR